MHRCCALPGEPPSFQITCYEPRERFAGVKDLLAGVVYQIFLTGLHEIMARLVSQQALAVQEMGFSRQLVGSGRRLLRYQQC